MIRRIVISIVAVTGIIVAAVVEWRSRHVPPAPVVVTTKAPAGAPTPTAALQVPLAARRAGQFIPPEPLPRPNESPLFRPFLAAKDFHAFYRSLDGRTDGDAKFMRAYLLEICKGWGMTYTGPGNEERLRASLARLKGQYLDIRRQIVQERAAYSVGTYCAGFPFSITQKTVEDAYTEAAEAGDSRGKLVELHRKLVGRADTRDVPTSGVPFAADSSMTLRTPDSLTDAEAALLKSALATRDPAQILFAGPMLSATYKDYELKFGDGKGLEGIYDGFLWTSVACHFGGGCGPLSQPVIEDCLINARCDVESYDDKLRKYILTPEQWPRFLAYRQTLIQAIDTQDWSLLQERRGPRTNTSGSVFPVETRSPRFRLRFP